MNITLITQTMSTRVAMAIQLDDGQPPVHQAALGRKVPLVRVTEWTEGQCFQVAISRGSSQRSCPLGLYF